LSVPYRKDTNKRIARPLAVLDDVIVSVIDESFDTMMFVPPSCCDDGELISIVLSWELPPFLLAA
jgi:hypothetical protein